MADPTEGGRVKVCGLCRRADVEVADDAGADYLGAVLSRGFSRSVDRSLVPELMEGVAARPVAVLVDEGPRAAAALAGELGAAVVQLHGDESPETAARIAGAGDWRVWKAVRLREPGELEAALERWAAVVDGLLVEGWKEGVTGGGGVRLGEEVARAAAGAIPQGLDFILAGGLTPDTVFDAVARFGPDVVDVSSGVERALCRKDPQRVRRFVAEARRAWSSSSDSIPPASSGAST